MPLGIPHKGRCLGFDPDTFNVIIAVDCSVTFSYDGHFFREFTTGRTLCPTDLTSGTKAVLDTTCAYALKYEFLVPGGSLVCTASEPNLCLTAVEHSPGNELFFADGSDDLFTLIYKGAFISIKTGNANLVKPRITKIYIVSDWFWRALLLQCTRTRANRQSWFWQGIINCGPCILISCSLKPTIVLNGEPEDALPTLLYHVVKSIISTQETVDCWIASVTHGKWIK